MSAAPTRTATTRGVVYVHSVPSAVCPHVEWALSAVLGGRVTLEWTPQPAQAGTYRAELSWQGEAGTGARLASGLRGFAHTRYEVTEEPSGGAEGERYSATPTLGIYHCLVGVHGDVLIPEDRLRAAVARAASIGEPVEDEIALLLGQPWDDELEPFRYAGDGAPVRWLHQVV